MKITILLFLILYSNLTLGFTINPNMSGFNSSNINIEIANSDCSGAGFSTAKYQSLIEDAVEEYWNKVSTSSIYLKVTGINTSKDIDGDQFSAAINKADANTILAGCNDDVTDFTDGSILGAAVGTCDSTGCRSVLILNAHANSYLKNKSDNEIKAVIAHEMGHAFGLGHSEYQHNLMYYSVSGKTQKWLGIDDIDGATYLYPHDAKIAGLLGSCGTIKDISKHKLNKEKKSIFSFLSLFALGLFISSYLFKILLSNRHFFNKFSK
jgi:predicted Zn-dependent protease